LNKFAAKAGRSRSDKIKKCYVDIERSNFADDSSKPKQLYSISLQCNICFMEFVRFLNVLNLDRFIVFMPLFCGPIQCQCCKQGRIML